MGVLNLTPDSFSDGGKYNKNNLGYNHAVGLYKHGSHIIDIGGESTRPGADAISAEEEIRRVIPIIKELAKNTELIISADTQIPIVA